MNILQLNVLSMTMVVHYLHTSPIQTNPSLISLSLKNKSLILFLNLTQTNLNGMIISRWRCSNYVPCKLLSLCNQKCISSGTFPNFWKYANIQPIHKKGNRQIKNNYRPIPLLPICGKILKKNICDNVYIFLNNNNLISKHQSGFRPGDSTICQLISITSTIYETIEKHDETRAIFLDRFGTRASFIN